MIDRGSTPLIRIELPIDTGTLKDVYMTFSQKGRVLIEKNTSQLILHEKNVEIKLTQEETLKFAENQQCEIQLAVKDIEGNVLRTDIFEIPVRRVLKNEVV